MSRIREVRAREILDSRGNPTVEADIKTGKGIFRAMVPSGASAGAHEALEMRDGDKSRYLGKGTLKAVGNVNKIISKKIIGMDCTKQGEIDNALLEIDGTENKGRLGANAMLPVSMAAVKTGAAEFSMPLYEYIGILFGVKPNLLPAPMCNVINGGKHAGQENSIQEHMLMPIGAKSFSEGIRMAAETYHCLKDMLKKKIGAGATLIGDEGGFAPKELRTVEERLDIMSEALKQAGYENEISFTLDPAASEFFKDGVYIVECKRMNGT